MNPPQTQSVLTHRGGGRRRTLADPSWIPVPDGKKSKLGRQYASIKSRKIMIRASSIIITLFLVYFPITLYLKSSGNPRQPHLPSDAIEENIIDIEQSQAVEVIDHHPIEQSTFLRSPKRDENEKATCKHLPSVYWINLDVSKERRQAIVKFMESSGVVDQHRVAAIDTKQATDLINSKQLMFHPRIKVYAGDGNPSFWKHGQNIYTYNEAACLMSHLKAIKQAYDDGHEVALILEDDASFSTFFCDEYDDYIAQAPEGWKVLQFATNNPHVVLQGSLLHEPFISWQRYHHSTRAYLINRAGMETLLGNVHYTSSIGESIWIVQEFPTVVADEAIYSLVGDTYYSTGLWIDTSALDSTIQKHRVIGRWEHPYSILEGKESEQVAMKSETTPAQLFGRSLLVVMNVCISNESQIEREIEVINQDIHAVCKFHRVCEWEINVVAVDESLTSLFEEAASGLPPHIHLHKNVHSEAFNKFLFVGDIRSKLANFDLMLFKDNDQRINGFPWRTFVEQTNDTVLSAPLRSTQRDHWLFMKEKEKSQDVQFHDVNHWLFWYNKRIWHIDLFDRFENIKPVEVPYLETYFTLMDAKFAKHFFESVFASGMLDKFSLDSIWCKAAFDWDKKRPSCTLIPLVSTHDDTLNNMKTDPFISKKSDPNSNKFMSLAKEWKEIVGKKHDVLEVEKHCLDRMNYDFVDVSDEKWVNTKTISDCAREFTKHYSLLPPPVEVVEASTPTTS